VIYAGDNSARLTEAMARAARVLYPNGEQDDCARLLQEAFGSPSCAMESGEQEMMRAVPVEESLAFAYSLVPAISRRLLAERAGAVRVLRSMEDVRTHLLPLYLGMRYECGHILCLDEKGVLIAVRQLRMGTISEAPFYLRIIVETALNSGCKYCILSHNHPAGTRDPSPADCSGTVSVMSALSRLGMLLIDHIIFADGTACSIRGSGMIAPQKWRKYAPLPEMYKGWPD